jgi:GNAT superfamily N-acetyltransferase
MNSPADASAIRVRPATPADVSGLAELCGQLSYPSRPDEVEQRLRGIEHNLEHAVFVAQRANGNLAGWVHVFVMRTVEADPRAEIGGLVVDESCRSRGVGRLLMEKAEQWTREHSCRAVGLRSNVIRERAHAFYERLGYKLIKTQKAFRKTLE